MRALVLGVVATAAGYRTGLLDHLPPCDLAQDPRTLAELGDEFKPSKFGWHRVPGGDAPDASVPGACAPRARSRVSERGA